MLPPFELDWLHGSPLLTFGISTPLLPLLLGSVFVLVALVNVGANLRDASGVARWSKPFLVPLLIAMAITWSLSSAHTTPVSWSVYLLIGALVFGWLGDVFLLAEGDTFFLLGLVSFLVGHVFYAAISLYWLSLWGWPSLGKILFALLAGGLYAFFAFPFMYSKARDDSLIKTFPIAVFFYSGVILTATILFLIAHLQSPTLGTEACLWGAALFLVSDTTLSKQVFYRHSKLRQGMLMCTYLAGQCLLTGGILAVSASI
ncbi:hypothetical protein BK816_06955 [Boudabousia tangfeifanii]|uniref:Lysoplasmalogenase n=1 Tax=Boudabousia tangfeifanii TaxID=1912795 RepID=A0A1D9MLF2_9ACTO|nr:lysoplasmalogenase [Boudabousia tangfeifanii]AOZ73058.1 hypothetical protein BK816_06955 [Boudabousia tangfeifanii]